MPSWFAFTLVFGLDHCEVASRREKTFFDRPRRNRGVMIVLVKANDPATSRYPAHKSRP
jgi:hypothetical protein